MLHLTARRFASAEPERERDGDRHSPQRQAEGEVHDLVRDPRVPRAAEHARGINISRGFCRFPRGQGGRVAAKRDD
jgi:hypothetical protein